MARFVRLFPVAFLLLATSTTAYADPFTVLPDGSVVFDVSMSSSGLFTCGSVLACTGSGTNSITLTSGGTATVAFTGVSSSFQAGNVTVPVPIGTFTTTTTANFMVPDSVNINAHLFSVDLMLSQTSPAVATDLVTWGFNRDFLRFGEGMRTYFQTPLGTQPPNFHYTSIIYSLRAENFSLPANGSKDLIADTGVVPEPASMLLVGSGLVGALYRRGRRSSAR
jgi:hypothetical protein